MSLRTRLFLLTGGLAVALVAAQLLLVRALAADLSLEVENVATSVGRSVAGVFYARLPCPEGQTCPEPPLPISGGHGEVRWEMRVRKPGETAPAGLAPNETPFEAQVGPSEETAQPGERLHRVVVVQTEGHLDPRAVDHLVRLQHEGQDPFLAFFGPNQAWHRIPIPAEGLFTRLDRFSTRVLAGSLALLVTGVGLAALVAYRISAPLRRLATAAREVGDGALGTRVEVAAEGEVGLAIAAFNRMSDRLAELDDHNRRLAAEHHLGEIGDVARGLAHSLRNPLNALGLSVEELAAGPDGARAAELAAAARRQIRRADRALRSFLALASEGGGTATAVDLHDVAADVALEVLHDGPGASVEVEAAPDLAPLPAVEPELRAVVHALVVNAAEASPAGSSVEVELAPWEDGCRVEVRDRGPGLPEAVRARLFTPHVSTKETGSGMGLFLAHRVATSRYGGGLALADREGGGTVATLTLRLRRSEDGRDG